MRIDLRRDLLQNLARTLVLAITILAITVVPPLIAGRLPKEVRPVKKPLDLEELELNRVVNRLDLRIVGRLGNLKPLDLRRRQGLLIGALMLGIPSPDVLTAPVVTPDAPDQVDLMQPIPRDHHLGK